MTPLTLTSGWEIIRAELQLRTLLQDSWGELTHEDTYKPDAEVGPLVTTLSRRMAELFVVLDGIGQDLRNELDNRIAAAVGDIPTPVSPESTLTIAQPPVEVEGSTAPTSPAKQEDQLLEAVGQYIVRRREGLSEPLHLASLAWDLQGEFGTKITADWLGFGRMVNLLVHFLPEDALVTSVPGLLLPKGMDRNALGEKVLDFRRPDYWQDFVDKPLPHGVPESAASIRIYDSELPLWPSEELRLAYEVLAAAHAESLDGYGVPDTRYLNMITRRARDLAHERNCRLGRTGLNYVGLQLLRAGSFNHTLNEAEIASVYSEAIIERMTSLGLLREDDENERKAVRSWLETTRSDNDSPAAASA